MKLYSLRWKIKHAWRKRHPRHWWPVSRSDYDAMAAARKRTRVLVEEDRKAWVEERDRFMRPIAREIATFRAQQHPGDAHLTIQVAISADLLWRHCDGKMIEYIAEEVGRDIGRELGARRFAPTLGWRSSGGDCERCNLGQLPRLPDFRGACWQCGKPYKIPCQEALAPPEIGRDLCPACELEMEERHGD